MRQYAKSAPQARIRPVPIVLSSVCGEKLAVRDKSPFVLEFYTAFEHYFFMLV